jgi:hypothetical protein
MALPKRIPIEKGGTNAVTAPDALTNLGAEAVANKSTNVVTDAASDTKYPSVKAIKEYADTKAPALTDDQNYVSDAELTNLNNQSGTNTGDETVGTIGDLIENATSRPTPAVTDLVPISNSNNNFDLEQLTIQELIDFLKPYLMDYQQLTVTKAHTGVGGGGNETQLFQVTGQVDFIRLSAKVTAVGNATTFKEAGWRFIDSVGNYNDITRTIAPNGANLNGTTVDAGVYKLGAATADAVYWNAGNARVIEATATFPAWILQQEVARDCFVAWKWTGDLNTNVTLEHSILWRPLSSDGNVVAV